MRTLSVSSALVMLTLVSCKTQRDNPNHCQNNDGNDWCGERDPARPFCSIGACTPDVEDGCVAERPEDDACYSPCGDDQTFEDDPSCDGVADTGTDATTLTTSMSETAPTATTDDPTLTTSMSMSESESETETLTSETESTTGPTGCVSNDECTDPTAPICQDMVCTGCTSAPDGDAACAEKDANAAVCREDGACVQCTPTNASACGDVTPFCDAASSGCVACAYHDECAESACDVDTGACFETDALVFVDRDSAACDDGGTGTMAVPYCNIQPAISAVPDGDSRVLLVAPSGAPYNGSLTIGGGKTIAILGSGIPFPIVTPSVGSTLTVTEAATRVYVEGLRFANNNSVVALSLSSGEVVLDRVEVVQNALNGSGILVTSGADLRLRNSVVGANGDSDGPTYGVLADNGTFEIIYSTLARNRSTVPSSIRCVNAGGGSVRNSIVVSDDPGGGSIDCAGIEIANSGLDEAVAGNTNVGDYQSAWFSMPGGGDFHLVAAGETEFEGLAVWESDDPSVDLDGDARPEVNRTPDVAGADVP